MFKNEVNKYIREFFIGLTVGTLSIFFGIFNLTVLVLLVGVVLYFYYNKPILIKSICSFSIGYIFINIIIYGMLIERIENHLGG